MWSRLESDGVQETGVDVSVHEHALTARIDTSAQVDVVDLVEHAEERKLCQIHALYV